MLGVERYVHYEQSKYRVEAMAIFEVFEDVPHADRYVIVENGWIRKIPSVLPQGTELAGIRNALAFQELGPLNCSRCQSCDRIILPKCEKYLPRNHPSVQKLIGALLAPAVPLVAAMDESAALDALPGDVSGPSASNSEPHDRVRLCDFCRTKIRKGKLPCVCLLNNLQLCAVPAVLQDLNRMEKRMIARVNCFHHIVILSQTGQRGMKGLSVAFRDDVPALVNSLPRALDESGVVIVKPPPLQPTLASSAATTRRQCARYEVHPTKIVAALMWLLEHNQLYRDISVDHGRFVQDGPVSLAPVMVQLVPPVSAVPKSPGPAADGPTDMELEGYTPKSEEVSAQDTL